MIKMIESIKLLDIFGKVPHFYINGHCEHKTVFGSLLTFFVFIISLFLVVGYGKELFTKENPTIFSIEDSVKNTSVHINSSNFFFAFFVVDKDGNITDPMNNIFISRSFIEHHQNIMNDETEKTNLTIVNCSTYNFDEFDVSNEIQKLILTNGMCVKVNNSLYSSPNLVYNGSHLKLQLLFNFSYLTENTSAFSEFLEDFPYSIYFFYQSNVYNPKNFKNPNTKGIGFNKFTMRQDTCVQIKANILFTKTETKTGLLSLNNHKIEENFGIKNFLYYYNRIDSFSDDKIIFDVIFTLNDHFTKNVREYQTLLNVLTQLGGSLQFFLMISTFLSNIFWDLDYVSHFFQIFNE